jgi:hypothetical protein
MKNTRRTIQTITISAAVGLEAVLAGPMTAQAAPKPGCADMAVLQELSAGLGGIDPAGNPKGEAAKLKKTADKLKAMVKTAPKELKPDYEFIAKLTADLSVSMAKIDLSKPRLTGVFSDGEIRTILENGL